MNDHDPDSDITHGQIAEAVRCWLHMPFYRIGMKEIGLPNGKRIDVLGYEPKDNTFRLFECKANSRDLKRIPTQLEDYRRYADLLYVAVPEKLEAEARELLPKKVGLLVVSVHGEGYHYLSTKSVRPPRRAPITERSRKAMTARALMWLLAHYEKTEICKNCGYHVQHGPV